MTVFELHCLTCNVRLAILTRNASPEGEPSRLYFHSTPELEPFLAQHEWHDIRLVSS